MTVDKAVMIFAGTVVLISVLLAVTFDLAWLWLTGVVGVMLVQAPLTGLCPAAMIFKKMGVRPGAAFPCDDNCCCKK
jgi:hypothetical protein